MNKLDKAKDLKPRKKTPAEFKRECYLRHRDKYLEKDRLRRVANKDKKSAYNKEYKQKMTKRLREAKVRSIRILRLKDVFYQFIDYSKDRFDEVTVRLRSANINKFFDYLDFLRVKRSSYCNKYWKEHGKFPKEEDDPVIRELKAIKYVFEIDRDFITRYVTYVNKDAVNRKTNQPLGQSEKEVRLTAFRAFLRFCQKKGYITTEIDKFVIIPKREVKVLKRALTIEEAERLLEAPDTNTTLGIRNRALLELAYSGLRADELLSLKPEHVDTVDNRIMILDSKGDKDRVAPMTEECIYWMKRWFTRRKELIGGHEDPGYIFITQERHPLLRQNFSRLIKKYAAKAGILFDLSPHDLRRATATHLVKNGAPIRQIQALLGHSTLQVTAKYLRFTDDEIKEEYLKSHPSNRRALHYGQHSDER